MLLHSVDCLTVDRSAEEDNSETVARNAANLKEAYKSLGHKFEAIPPTKVASSSKFIYCHNHLLIVFDFISKK